MLLKEEPVEGVVLSTWDYGSEKAACLSTLLFAFFRTDIARSLYTIDCVECSCTIVFERRKEMLVSQEGNLVTLINVFETRPEEQQTLIDQ